MVVGSNRSEQTAHGERVSALERMRAGYCMVHKTTQVEPPRLVCLRTNIYWTHHQLKLFNYVQFGGREKLSETEYKLFIHLMRWTDQMIHPEQPLDRRFHIIPVVPNSSSWFENAGVLTNFDMWIMTGLFVLMDLFSISSSIPPPRPPYFHIRRSKETLLKHVILSFVFPKHQPRSVSFVRRWDINRTKRTNFAKEKKWIDKWRYIDITMSGKGVLSTAFSCDQGRALSERNTDELFSFQNKLTCYNRAEEKKMVGFVQGANWLIHEG